MGGFREKGPPEWAAQPCRTASIEMYNDAPTGGRQQVVPIDKQPSYLLGRGPHCDVTLQEVTASKEHAAIIHHSDGRIFLIDLCSTNGTILDGGLVPKNKPTELRNGASLQFGSDASLHYIVRCETSGEKRRSRGEEAPATKRHSRSNSEGIVRASHLLVKHRAVRRPSSWKEAQVTRSPEEALVIIQAFREQLISSSATPDELAQHFADLASRESHCSSAKKGGDLGPFGPGQMQEAFDKGTRALQVGELSQPITSDSGVHLILRTSV